MKIKALVGEYGSGHSEALRALLAKHSELVSFKHNFRNLSNTSDFYYQQRFNSLDADDALTVEQHLDAIATNQGSWTKTRVVETFHLERLLNEQVIKLSNGETKRVLIASALLKNPRLLLLDHPLTGLDYRTREHFGQLLKEISSSGIEVVLATGPDDIPETVTEVIHMQSPKENNRFELDEAALRSLLSVNYPSFNVVIGMNDVHIEYDGKVILDKINWTVKQGDRWSLLGPNGAGKSTLLSLITGDNPQAYANDILLFDRQRGSGESIWDIKNNIGFVSPELYQYFPTDTSCLHVIESGFYDTVGLFRASDPVKEQQCRSWMKLMQIEKFEGILFNRVATDVQRLCLLARALVKCPPLLILDEPTQGLTADQQQFFTRLIEAICNITNVTLVFVSHYQRHIPQSVNHSLQLEEGKISFIGSTDYSRD